MTKIETLCKGNPSGDLKKEPRKEKGKGKRARQGDFGFVIPRCGFDSLETLWGSMKGPGGEAGRGPGRGKRYRDMAAGDIMSNNEEAR